MRNLTPPSSEILKGAKLRRMGTITFVIGSIQRKRSHQHLLISRGIALGHLDRTQGPEIKEAQEATIGSSQRKQVLLPQPIQGEATKLPPSSLCAGLVQRIYKRRLCATVWRARKAQKQQQQLHPQPFLLKMGPICCNSKHSHTGNKNRPVEFSQRICKSSPVHVLN